MPDGAHAWSRRFAAVRARTEALAAPLSAEDQQLQSMPSCSPTKWHRAHTTWFFETFVLGPRGIAPVEPAWSYLFNSYYEALGPRHARPARGLLSRPSCDEIARYRRIVDERVHAVIAELDPPALAALAPVLALGRAAQEQHQELLLTDALHALAQHPHHPRYRTSAPALPVAATAAPPRDEQRSQPGWIGRENERVVRSGALTFTPFAGGLVTIGHDGPAFAFDSEGPRHRVWLEPFALADRLVTHAEVQAFAADGGYRTPSLWLSAGWAFVQAAGLARPAYVDGDGQVFGLDGLRAPAPDEPAAFLSLFEADAIARWLGGRLPTEAEWEVAAQGRPVTGNTLAATMEDSALRPLAAAGPLAQLFGDVWEWTGSSYQPYPGYAPAGGALGEYNGKFMIDQHVLRGGSCFTPPDHLRVTYRNFWPADTRFQVTGVRLAREP